MLTEDNPVYQVTFGIADNEQFEQWFPKAVVRWATLEPVGQFRVFRSLDEHRQRYQLLFVFDTESDWLSFVDTDTHSVCINELERMGTDVRTMTWMPGTVKLVGDGPVISHRTSESTELTVDGHEVTADLADMWSKS